MDLTRKILFILLGGALLIIALSAYVSKTWEEDDVSAWQPGAVAIKSAQVKINSQIIQAEVALSSEEHYLGLSGRESLCADCGLLFKFSNREPRVFVMRDMNFPLDILFISEGRIVSLAENLAPEDKEPERFYSSGEPVELVLEVNGGYSAAHNFKVGDQVSIIYED